MFVRDTVLNHHWSPNSLKFLWSASPEQVQLLRRACARIMPSATSASLIAAASALVLQTSGPTSIHWPSLIAGALTAYTQSQEARNREREVA